MPLSCVYLWMPSVICSECEGPDNFVNILLYRQAKGDFFRAAGPRQKRGNHFRCCGVHSVTAYKGIYSSTMARVHRTIDASHTQVHTWSLTPLTITKYMYLGSLAKSCGRTESKDAVQLVKDP